MTNREPGARPPQILDSGVAARRGIEPYGTYEVTDPLAYPNVTTGKIFARDRGGSYTCSGTVVNSRSNNILFTAAHCVRTKRWGWARRLIFIPAYEDGAAPRGRWDWKTLYVPPQWTSFRFDYAAVKLQRRGGRNIEARTGSTGFAWNQPYSQDYRALGYPGNYFNGRRMMGCFSPLARIDWSMGRPGADRDRLLDGRRLERRRLVDRQRRVPGVGHELLLHRQPELVLRPALHDARDQAVALGRA